MSEHKRVDLRHIPIDLIIPNSWNRVDLTAVIRYGQEHDYSSGH